MLGVQGGPTEEATIDESFHPVSRRWFREAFKEPTRAQQLAWPVIAKGEHTLLLAPTGSGKTLAAFFVAIDRLMFGPAAPEEEKGVRVLYVSPLKALGVDVERNLRSPLAGVRALAQREGADHQVPRVGVRSGDTPSAERERLARDPPEILITTPESLYLILTSRKASMLRTVETVIIDEIHTMVSTKRGAHLFLSLERLDRLRREGEEGGRFLQRIGLSATQRPLDEVARLLGGSEATSNPDETPHPRPVTIVDAGRRRRFDLRIEVPVEDMAELGEVDPIPSGPAAGPPALASIWPAIHPRLVELIESHRTTMIFVNSRRLAERLANAINELAEKELALAHHGSIAKETRLHIEDRLKRGTLPAIVATSSLELGIDMGAVDLVIQIEAPPSIASGIQRIGRSGHHVDATSVGVVFPKYRGDLLACAAAAEKMLEGEVEETYFPRNPLDVLAQQIVAMVALGARSVGELYATARQAAPFHELSMSIFEGVLDLLSGRYPSDEFAGLRPRVTWDRLAGMVAPRKGTQRTAILNAGTIPDRGLYGVYLIDDGGGSNRVGELDEEMVFETRPGEIFLLGASSWRVLEITHDRVLVAPAPGEPGKMPFWRGDGLGRTRELGVAMGVLARELLKLPREKALDLLVEEHALDRRAATNLVQYLRDQVDATEEVPSDRTIVIESFLDEIGDWRVAILSPFGSRVHTPWAMAVRGRLTEKVIGEVDVVWSDDGIVFRLPESDSAPVLDDFWPNSDEIEDLIVNEVGGTALFAARFRENAARSLLLPRRRPDRRTPLWIQRRRSADLLAVASRYESFPILLETYRECLRDVFDLSGLRRILRSIERRDIRVHAVETRSPSPFAASLLFNYVGNFLYEGDAPLNERRAQSLALDHAQLRELLGESVLRELLDGEVVDTLALELQRLEGAYEVTGVDALRDLVYALGDLSREEIFARLGKGDEAASQLDGWLVQLVRQRRLLLVKIAGEPRYVAAEDAARLRDALGVVTPPGLPEAFLEEVVDPLGDLVSRYARTHVPFTTGDVARRFGVGPATIEMTLRRLAGHGRVFEGEFLPGGTGREWCDAEVLRVLKRRSLARLRKEVEPVDARAFARFLPRWHGLERRRHGLDGLLDVVEMLQGMPLPASTLEEEILPARVEDYRPGQLDELCNAGEVVWRGFGSGTSGDGRIALYLTDHLRTLAPTADRVDHAMAEQLRDYLAQRGAVFFDDLLRVTGGFPNDVLATLWELVWAGEVTNDTLAPLRSLQRDHAMKKRRASRRGSGFRSRRQVGPPGSEGRWSLLGSSEEAAPTPTERQAAIALQLLQRHGILVREAIHAEGIVGGFAGLYPVLKGMEEAGRIRRGYFVAGLGAAQFAASGAEQRLRDCQHKQRERSKEVHVLAATDPANPYGAVIAWPSQGDGSGRPQRAAGARVVIRDGTLLAFLSRSAEQMLTFPAEDEEESAAGNDAIAQALAEIAERQPILLRRIDGEEPSKSPVAPRMLDRGFRATSRGLVYRPTRKDVTGNA
ncbi:ATP-dependent RNA helicase RhlE [Planctomycetes bacterium Pan216]|uniref:ATP-dependent RNA helicase RhlE n=1 Tax=Kolteria novifilia TaxID=2527975 RepID=A0A518B799_9BACT|nr:ATP-dependent RNA helicase RhlE [Planctomycetes bacterium Pan216]